jgi:hypothetical protein
MSDRLAELRRQRALVQQHLAWLDLEIATAAGSAPTNSPVSPIVALPPSPSVPAQALLSAPGVAQPRPLVQAPDPEAIIAQYRSEPTSVRNDVRKGCLLYFAGAFVLLGLGVMAMYYLLRAR